MIINEDSAYLLGWIASCKTTISNDIKIRPDRLDNGNPYSMLELLEKIANNNGLHASIVSVTSLKDKVVSIQLFDIPAFHTLSEQLQISFLRGLYSGNGSLHGTFYQSFGKLTEKLPPICTISSLTKEYSKSFARLAPCSIENEDGLYKVVYEDVNVIDFLGKLYNGYINGYIKIDPNYKVYNEWVYNNWREPPTPTSTTRYQSTLLVYKTDERAVIPFKCRGSDAGFDITIIDTHYIYNERTTLYDTGIQLRIPIGYYVEIVARSSLSKYGYMLANNVAIIDNGYTGNIYIALTKIVDNAHEIKLPFRCCQLILKKQLYMPLKETFKEISCTDRSTGGFGSTNKNTVKN